MKALKEKLSFLKYLDPDHYSDALFERLYGKAEGKRPFHHGLAHGIITLAVYSVFAFALYYLLGVAFNTSEPIVIVISESMEPALYRGDVAFVQGVPAPQIKAQPVTLSEDVRSKPLASYSTIEHAESSPECLQSAQIVALENCERGNVLDCRPTFERLKEFCATAVRQVVFEEGQIVTPSADGDIIVYYSKYSNRDIIHRAQARISTPGGEYFLTKGDNLRTNPSLDQDCQEFQGQLVNCVYPYAIPFEDVRGKVVFKIPWIGYIKLILFGR